jgi:hypothetical protein
MVLGGPQSHVVSRINCVLDSRALHSLITNLHIRRDEVPLIVYAKCIGVCVGFRTR